MNDSLNRNSAFEITTVEWRHHREQLQQIRQVVFIQEQNVPVELEWDGEDENAFHVLAFSHEGKAVGTVRLLRSGQIGRMAVLQSFRRNGVGAALLQYILDVAHNFTENKLFLHAQVRAIPFYEKFGFEIQGDMFMDAGIEHKEMRFNEQKHLTLGTAQLGENPQRFLLGDFQRTLAALNSMIGQTRRYVKIFSPDLERELYDTEKFRDQISAFARLSRYSEVRILVQQIEDMVQNGHRLLELSRKLPSKVTIKLLSRGEDIDCRSFILADSTGLIIRPEYENYQGFCNFHAKNAVENLADEFDRYWELAEIDPQFRTITL